MSVVFIDFQNIFACSLKMGVKRFCIFIFIWYHKVKAYSHWIIEKFLFEVTLVWRAIAQRRAWLNSKRLFDSSIHTENKIYMKHAGPFFGEIIISPKGWHKF